MSKHFKKTFERFTLWVSTFCSLALFCMNLKDVLNDLKEINDAMIEIK